MTEEFPQELLFTSPEQQLTNTELFCAVALNIPVFKLFHYRVPPQFREQIAIGKRLKVPFRNRTEIGFCIELLAEPEVDKVFDILDILDLDVLISPLLLKLAEWIGNYYCSSLGEVLDAILPRGVKNQIKSRQVPCITLTLNEEQLEESIQGLQEKHPHQARILRVFKEGLDQEFHPYQLARSLGITMSPFQTLRKKGILKWFQKEVPLDPFEELFPVSPAVTHLTKEQKSALDQLVPHLVPRQFSVSLLEGVTGSGKTEVYLRAIQTVIQNKQQAIVLVPEIALTPQTVARFKQKFSRIALLHSKLTDAQRHYQWKRIYDGEADVIIGPRSAVFAPVRDLGLIVLDEEHETTFKQQNAPFYHAREVAIMRAKMEGAAVVLGTATPSLDTYYKASSQKYHHIRLYNRVNDQSMPQVYLVNMGEEMRQTKQFVLFSRLLKQTTHECLERKEQAIFFLNRRGFSTYLDCKQCGWVLKCKSCDVSLTYHKKMERALCHYCSYEEAPPQSCPDCFFPTVRYAGTGTEKIEALTQRAFPEARIARMDGDTMRSGNAYQKVLTQFQNREIDILIGTQMIAKGLDFHNVTLVGVVHADSALNFPDFRAAERTFQLIAQVSGRTGRGGKRGLVVVQTFQPQHYAIQKASACDYESFAREELRFREALGYPPFGSLFRVVIRGEELNAVIQKAEEIAQKLRDISIEGIDILGPAPAPITRIKNKFRYQIIAKSAHPLPLQQLQRRCRKFLNPSGNVQCAIDIDPLGML